MQQYCTGAKASMSCLEGKDGNRVFVLELLLHFADISNPYKPFSICEKWADLVVEEFGRQGDRERSEDMEVIPMMDRNLIIVCNTQLGHIDFVVAPLLSVMVRMFPPLYEIEETMLVNYLRRQREVMSDESLEMRAREEEFGKSGARMAKWREKLSEAEALKY